MTWVTSVDQVQDRAADVTDGVERDTEEHCHEDDLQDVALDERADHAVGDQVGDELPPLLGLAGGDQLLRPIRWSRSCRGRRSRRRRRGRR